ncbi:hypothetical protein LQ567_14860 [Niabella pedocola]|uniref:DUF998 domain-containing protein n=1 Tax=Niabella pedocola TaxID=1752077 RepID=A0ABS8PSM1_9BACT|nr:hypothetical protein [Niabella pedocola]MCD2424057.1 hypothetical protein [Niabella pedocola]
MQSKKDLYRSKTICLLPVAGVCLFVLLYIISTFLYPGGSQADNKAPGFSWLHNYWCNLLNDQGINGQRNPAKWWARAGMVVLGSTFCIFWWSFFYYTGFSKATRAVITGCGAVAMVLGMFLSTAEHDVLVTLSGALGFIAMAFTFAGLLRLKWHGLFRLGIFNVFLVLLNNLCYYTPSLIYLLPLIQKITFLLFLVWLCLICFRMRSIVMMSYGKPPAAGGA